MIEGKNIPIGCIILISSIWKEQALFGKIVDYNQVEWLSSPGGRYYVSGKECTLHQVFYPLKKDE